MIPLNNYQFASVLKSISNMKTLYVMGCFGAPMTAANKIRYTNNHEYNRKSTRSAMIKSASADTFGFDCVGLIKGVLWGWDGSDKTYGGANYASNGVPDINADTMITRCKDVSTDFSSIEIGEAVWIPGHIGVYIGDGKVVESSPQWRNGVQITSKRKWQKHGKLPYITYATKGEEDIVIVELDTLKANSRGEQVKALQRLLVGYGYDLKVDGAFGTITDRHVRSFQRKHGLSADGIVGNKTWNKLLGTA